MRQRFSRAQRAAMARRPGEDGRFALSPRARRIGGWVAAILLIVVIAVIVGVVGGDGDGTAVIPSPSSSASAGPGPAEIAFGTEIDSVTGEVSAASATTVFTAGDPFAWSVRPEVAPPSLVFVHVVRTSGTEEVVQDWASQSLPDGAAVISFRVEAAALVADFGIGQFEMRVATQPGGVPIAIGTFELRERPGASAAPSP
jgi:hypothetical protein